MTAHEISQKWVLSQMAIKIAGIFLLSLVRTPFEPESWDVELSSVPDVWQAQVEF